MGYTTQKTSMLLGLGVSSISDAGTAFAQNAKTLSKYYEAINKNETAVFRGCFLDEEDVAFRKYILNISCEGKTNFYAANLPALKEYSFPELEKLAADGLVEWNEEHVQVTELGRHFIRNICSAFDLHLLRNQTESGRPMFSKAI